MTARKLKKLMAHIKKFGVSAADTTGASMQDLQTAFGELMKLEAAENEKKFPKPQFSSWPPEMPERKCSWRLSDELQEARLRVPEPYYFQKNTVMKFPPITLKRRAFETEDGSVFYAWTADGRTPIFPIPL